MIQIIDFLKNFDETLLPGWEAQRLMSPPYRGELDMNAILAKQPKQGAVAIILYYKNDELHFILTQRQEYEGTHSGQVSFPGGKKDGNEHVLDTAIRETKEEIGVALSQEHFCCSLSPIYIPPSHFLVSPQVFFMQQITEFTKDVREVKEIVEVPLIQLFLADNKTNKDIATSQGLIKNIPAYTLNEKIVWGATAVILSELEQILNQMLDTIH
jgi:8-oxo-dGTP pyrophosphatase MutT (NUDIX family)